MTRNFIGALVALSALVAQPVLAQDNFGNGVTIQDSDLSTADLFVRDTSVLDGNLCIGNDCVNTEAFTNDELVKLKSAALSILFDDFSGASFPARDWRLVVNDVTQNSLGGQEKFAVDDVTAGTTPFTILGGAPSNALYVAASGMVGLGTNMPTTDLHMTSALSDKLRMQNTATGADWVLSIGSTGFGLGDIGGGGSAPFFVEEGGPNNALWIDASGDLGVGLNAPEAPLHVRRNSTTSPGTAPAGILVEDIGTSVPRGLMTLRNTGNVFFALENTSIAAGDNTGRQWNFQNNGGEFRVTTAPGGGSDIEMRLLTNGDMIIEGNYFASSGTQLNVPDYVFDADYDLKPLAEVQAFIDTHSHLPGVPSAAEINAQGLNMTDMQMRLLKKVEELTLYTLDQQEVIQHQSDALTATRADMAALIQAHAALAAQMETLLDGR